MDNLGLLIKEERLRQKMKQITLAKGICTPSYLSKIEKKRAVPSSEITSLLVERLKIENNYLVIEKDSAFLHEVLSLYKLAVLYRDKEMIKQKLEYYTKNDFKFQDESNFYTLKLIQLRLFLISDQKSRVLPLMKTLENMGVSHFNSHQLFILNMNRGIFHHIEGDFCKALESFEANLELINKFPIEDWELADFYNVLSLSYLTNNQNLNTIDYATKCLKFFKDNLFFERSVDSHMVIAIAQKRNFQYGKAEENLKLAQQLSTEMKLKQALGRIHQNLGSLFSIQGDSSQSIEHFKASLKYKKGTSNYLISFLSLIQEYSKKGNSAQVVQWCNKGLHELENKSIKNHEAYYHHFKLYLSLILKDENCINVIKKAIRYFENKNDYRHVHKYSLLLADVYFEEIMYKNARIFY